MLLSSAQADDKLPLDSALNNILTQIYLFPQEKIYIQTDRPYYISGEKIFFRCFLLNAFTHQPTEMSRYVYVELINSKDSVVVRQQIRPENQMHYGAISLADDLPQGHYRIRSYTRFMENIGDDYFFTQPVYIADPREDMQKIEKSHSDEKFEVTFYPEGGNMIAGQSCNIAFKALSSNGNVIEISGEVFDSQNNQLTNFSTSHEGMGRFVLKVEEGKEYYALCKKGNQSIKVNLPEVKSGAYALATTWRQNKLWISVKQDEGMPQQKMYLFIHSSGLAVYADEWDYSKEFITIDKNNLPTGISHILLLNEDFYPFSERLVFSINDDWLTAEIKTQKEIYKNRDYVRMDVELQGIAGKDGNNSVSGSFSVSVTDDKDIKIGTTSNILTDILLTSELRGYIPNPAYYFQKNNREAEFAADLLMMIHGWNRYDIPRAMRGDFQLLKVANEESQSFSGIVKGGLLSKPYKGSKVTILSTDNSFFDQTETDENGRFIFNNFEFMDSTNYFIQALSIKGKDIVELYLDDITFPKVYPRKIDFFKQKKQQLSEPEEFNDEEFKDYVVKANQKWTYENGVRTIHLNEVTIKAPWKQSTNYLQPDNSLSELQIKTSGDMRTLLSHVPSMTATFDKLRIGSNNSPPMIIVDGMVLSVGDNENGGDNTMDLLAINILHNLNMEDIAKIDIIKSSAKVYAYGYQGKNGVIEVYTKNGYWNSNKPRYNILQTTPLGYQKPVEFYSPRYYNDEVNSSIPDLRSTIYWKPDVILNSKGKATLDFYTADSPSTYSVVIEGVTSEGELIYQRQPALVKVE